MYTDKSRGNLSFFKLFFRPHIRLLEVGIFRKGKWGRKARKRPPTERKWSPAVILQRVGCGRKAKVGSKRKVGTDRKGWGHFAKDIYVRSKVGQKRIRTAEAVLMRCQFYSLPFEPGKVKGYPMMSPVSLSRKTTSHPRTSAI